MSNPFSPPPAPPPGWTFNPSSGEYNAIDSDSAIFYSHRERSWVKRDNNKYTPAPSLDEALKQADHERWTKNR
jgi:hypothetical protein